MAKIAPSILSADFANLAADCRRVMPSPDSMLHFDVMDGVFVPNLSFGLPVLAGLKKALPQAEYDVHLMIVDPAKYIDDFARAGADGITFHFEAESPFEATARAIREKGLRAGVSLKPGTPIEVLLPRLAEVDMVLVMSVEPGFGGQKFMPQALERLAMLKEEITRQRLDVLLEVDGGIDATTGPQCLRAGADILVAGSAVFGAQDPLAAIGRLLDVSDKNEKQEK